MENIEQILQKLVAVNLPPIESDKVQHLIKHAFEAGKAEKTDPLDGYSNLTAAISAGEPIDYEKLDGLNVKCANPELRGELHGTLERDPDCLPDVCGAWWGMGMDDAYLSALVDAWHGIKGWTLYVEGDIPLIRKTADQLEPGYFFTGVLSGTTSESLMCVASGPGIGKNIRYASDLKPSFHPGTKWEVIEEHGPFQKPEGK